MSEKSKSEQKNTSDQTKGAWVLMCAVLILELLGTVILTVSAVSGLRFAETEPVQDLVALVIMALVANAWVLITLIGAYNRKTWGRSAALIVQIAVFAAAFAAFQGLLGFFALGFFCCWRWQQVESLRC